MAYATHARSGYHHPQQPDHPVALSAPPPQSAAGPAKRPAYFDDDDSAILDPSILDADIMQSPDDAHLRKRSFAHSNPAVISPGADHAWDPHYAQGLPVDASAGAYQDDHVYLRQNPQLPQPQPYGHASKPPQWAYEQGSGQCTPSNGVDMMPPPQPAFDAPNYSHQRSDSVHQNFGHALPHSAPQHPPAFGNGPHGDGNFIPAPQVQAPMSPHNHSDWMALAQQEVETRPVSKRMRPSSPPRTTVDYQRRDGIRKKNGRIDIPHERNIQTIDEMIENTVDDDMLKELKQQKRLLRNREAALASRQRKKKHTEDLETQQKDFSRTVNGLTSQIESLEIARQEQSRTHQMMTHRMQELQRINETVQDEKRNLVMKHTEETASLRKKVQVLREQIEAGPAPAMSAAPSSTGFTDFSAEMEALNMGNTHDWDSFLFDNNDMQAASHNDEFYFDANRESPVLEKKASSVTNVHDPPKKSQEDAADPPVASGLLFFLLLCGAFVASRPANNQTGDLPQVPPNVRAAAPTVLNSLLADSNQPSTQTSRQITHTNGQHEPVSSGAAKTNPRPRGRLDQMHQHLTTPTKQQEIDSAFSLTSSQYASITNMDMPQHYHNDRSAQQNATANHNQHGNQQQPHPARRSLAEALAANSHERNGNRAEVYTRSLLWDQIPTDVVRQFKEMVRDAGEIEASQQLQQQEQGQQGQDQGRGERMYGYKAEA